MRKPCCEKQDNKKGAWTNQEDHKLIQYILKHGKGCWRTIPQAAGLLRCSKSCRLRWINYLRPDLKRGNFAEDEEDLIVKLHALLGNRWSLIAGRLPGRTDNEVKNYWNSHLSRKITNMGLDPNNHRWLPKISDEEAASKASVSGLDDDVPTTGSLLLPDLNLNLDLDFANVVDDVNQSKSVPMEPQLKLSLFFP